MDIGLYTNRNSRSDFIKNAIDRFTHDSPNVYIAVAFFTENTVIKEILSKRCLIRLIIRLGFPTNPFALKSILGLPNVEIRYFTNRAFHPKLFIFGDTLALVGSANLTKAAILTNQEIMISVSSEDSRFTELASLFAEYWNDAKVLTHDILEQYSSVYNKHKHLSKKIKHFDDTVIEHLGDVVSHNIQRDVTRESKENVFLDTYRKTYQECVTAFNRLKEIYELVGGQKAKNESSLPLHLEVDRFISYLRDTHAIGESWRNSPIISGETQEQTISAFVKEWRQKDNPDFETMLTQEYRQLMQAFSSAEITKQSDDETLFEALTVINSFRERLRFFPGGLTTLKTEFFQKNGSEKIKESLTYLIFGDGDIVERMANLIFNSQYKLQEFGQSNVQELIGWVNQEDLPIVNGRTTKVLRYLGFDIKQI